MNASPSVLSSKPTFADHLAHLYGSERAREFLPRLEKILQSHEAASSAPPGNAGPFTERDAILITYADMLHQPGKTPLRTLADFLKRRLSGLVSGVHLLPFFPYSSDDGFSVIDYRKVDPALGTWEDIETVARDFRLMVDAVINHASVQNVWFQRFLADEPPYSGYFITVDPEADLSEVVRPRDLPLLTPFRTAAGTRYVWTTFSADQVDLNFGNPEVLLEVIDLLLYYLRRGAQIIRLDAVAYLWKKAGTPSIHLEQTHRIVQLLRAIFDAVSPWAFLITETNVPHEENLSYLGDGSNEAHLVYQFTLPPLVLHTFACGDASRLTAWASSLTLPSGQAAFFNFLASHDGIGLRPAREILSDEEIEALVERAKAHGGRVSYRSLKGKGRQPYELNITYFDALTEPGEAQRAPGRAVARFLSSQAIMLALVGVPGIYFHSLFGSRNHREGVERTGRPRSINREKLPLPQLETRLDEEHSVPASVFRGYARLLAARRGHPAFDPAGEQQVVDLDPRVFAVMRRAPGGTRRVLCLHEVSGRGWEGPIELPVPATSKPVDLITRNRLDPSICRLEPYAVRWLGLNETEI